MEDAYRAPDDVTAFETGGADERSLRVGERVRSIAEPVFSSDRNVGDVGQVRESQDGSALVRWADGSETWAARASFQPLRVGDPIVTPVESDLPPVSSSSPGPVEAAPATSRVRSLVRLVVPILLFAPALARVVPRSTGGLLFLVVAVVVGVGMLWAVSRHRTAVRQAAIDAEAAGTTDQG